MRRPVLRASLTAGLLVLLAPAAASAASFDVEGGGFGHGVGMSQYGAYGYALEGKRHEGILRHYYTGTDIGHVDPARVRVLLQASRPAPASFSNARGADGRRLRPGRTYTVEPAGHSRFVLRVGDRRVGRFREPLRVRGDDGRVRLGGTAMNGLDDGLYRGRMEFRHGLSGGITAINIVAIDDYVRGVVSAEMPASWPQEALRAQAVVARSYALATSASGDIFDHYPDTRSQVYRGVSAESAATDRAVRRTADEVVRHDGEVARTYFFSTSGGHTEDSENVFGSRVPYLRGVRDPYDDISPFHRWSVRFARAEMQQRLGSLVLGRLRGIRVLQRGASPRIVAAKVRGSDGSTRVSGATLMSRLGTYDIPSAVQRVRRSASPAAVTTEPSPADSGAVTTVVPAPEG